MNRIARLIPVAIFAVLTSLAVNAAHPQANATEAKYPPITEGDFVVHHFKFKSGQSMAEVRLHYTTLGKPAQDAQGRTTNAVLVLHGTGGSGYQFLAPYFAGEVFNPGQVLDASRYYLILVDGIGHGKSSKPSDGMHAHFPEYDYDDMVALHHALLTDGLKVNHLRLIFGTSMGCMQSFVWGETYPDFMDALMPMACLPVQIAGRNRIWRKMVMDGIRADPEWKNGDYTTQPAEGIRIALDFLLIAGSAPIPMQESLSTRDAADKYLAQYFHDRMSSLDANDFWFQLNASRDYDPSANLEKIKVPVMWLNSADDFINPPDLGIAEREVKRLKNGKFILIPASEQTHGHGTHTFAAIWKDHMAELLQQSAH
ncbi:MAG TPA: alpha/beta fold hydrolase [Candidatus Sulfotelmatobacter sp.]|nr:alpha/beta fold hydrolase [Candidatus Sulfotelmatobacter sp.]